MDKPWLKYYSEKVINSNLQECSIYDYLFNKNQDYPLDIALIYLGKEITFKELFERIDMTAAAFTSAGVKEKDIVTIALPSIPEAVYCVYALNKIGAIANMIHPLAGKEETINYLNEVESKIAVIFDAAYETLAADIGKTKVEKAIVVSPSNSLPLMLKAAYRIKVRKPKLVQKEFIWWNSFIRNGKGTEVRKAEKNIFETAIISHTGGTTGNPKGVMCSDYSCNSLMWQLLCNFEFQRQECSLNVLPPFVNYSLLESIMAMLAEGMKVALLPKYDPMKFDKYVKKYKPNQILSIPAYWEAVLKIPNIHKTDMSCLKHLYAGGEAMSLEIKESIDSLIQSCGANTRLYTALGSTEMIAGATITYENCYYPGSVGIPMVRVNCKIVDPQSGEELTYGNAGEICFSGDTMMLGYYDNQEATDDIIKQDKNGVRWLHTGDIGYITEDGIIYVTGRIKRIFMTKGRDGQVTKMFPDRIEASINTHKDVEACCVIGIPDRERINYPKAFLVLNKFANSKEVKKEIIDICKKSLPEYMIPYDLEVVDDMPRTSRGKIDYRALESYQKKNAG